ncbi:unnamed protein product [Rhizophagus irregularis]|nr:unnamed protein product [Rhizophagus irregularis]
MPEHHWCCDRVNKKFDGIDSLAPGLPRLIHQKTIIKNIQHLPAKFYRNHLPPPNYQEKILQKNVIILGKIRREKYHLKQLAKCEAHAQFLEQQEEAELREMQEAIMEMGNHKPPPPDPEYQRELTKFNTSTSTSMHKEQMELDAPVIPLTPKSP